MSFKQFLAEMPWFNNANIKAKCPKGDVVDGANPEYHYDTAYEFLPDELKIELSVAQSQLRHKFVGILPMYCKIHDLLFMYDFDKKKKVKDKKFKDTLNKVRLAMRKHPDHKGMKIEIYS